MAESKRKKTLDRIMKDIESVKVLSSAEYWERKHRLRCLSLYRQEVVGVTGHLPEDMEFYREIIAIGNRASNEIERYEEISRNSKKDDVEENPIEKMTKVWEETFRLDAENSRGAQA